MIISFFTSSTFATIVLTRIIVVVTSSNITTYQSWLPITLKIIRGLWAIVIVFMIPIILFASPLFVVPRNSYYEDGNQYYYFTSGYSNDTFHSYKRVGIITAKPDQNIFISSAKDLPKPVQKQLFISSSTPELPESSYHSSSPIPPSPTQTPTVATPPNLSITQLQIDQAPLEDFNVIAGSNFAVISIDKAGPAHLNILVEKIAGKWKALAEIPKTAAFTQGQLKGSKLILIFIDTNGDKHTVTTFDKGKTWTSK